MDKSPLEKQEELLRGFMRKLEELATSVKILQIVGLTC